MSGEKYDENFKVDRFADKRDEESGFLLAATLCWLGIFYLFLRPLNFLPSSKKNAMLTRYEEVGGCIFSLSLIHCIHMHHHSFFPPFAGGLKK